MLYITPYYYVILDKEGNYKMTCKSAIYTTNDTGTTVTVTNDIPVQVPYGAIIRRFGQNVQSQGGSIQCCGAGYFDVDQILTVTPTEAGPITARLYQDDKPIRGAFMTLTGEANTPIALPIKALIRNCGCDCSSVLTITIDGSCVINNFPAVVKKL